MLVTIGERQGIQAVVSTIGATLVSLLVPDRTGRMRDVVLGMGTEDGCRSNTNYLGASVGRFANRIAGAAFELDGRRCLLDANEGANSLHGGSASWHTRDWALAARDDDSVTLALESADGDQGYPGALHVTARYRIEGTTLKLVYEAVSETTTIVNITNHSYFNLNGHDAGSVMQHSLRLDAHGYLPVDGELIPTGEIAPVTGTPFDFGSERTLVADVPPGGFDHCIVLAPRTGCEHAARLTGDESGITMDLFTTQPGVQFYSGNVLDEPQGKGGARYGRRDALCLEAELFPDAVHHPEWPSPVVEAGQPWRWETHWSFGLR